MFLRSPKVHRMDHWPHPKHRKAPDTFSKPSPKVHHMIHWPHSKHRKAPHTFAENTPYASLAIYKTPKGWWKDTTHSFAEYLCSDQNWFESCSTTMIADMREHWSTQTIHQTINNEYALLIHIILSFLFSSNGFVTKSMFIRLFATLKTMKPDAMKCLQLIHDCVWMKHHLYNFWATILGENASNAPLHVSPVPSSPSPGGKITAAPFWKKPSCAPLHFLPAPSPPSPGGKTKLRHIAFFPLPHPISAP
jgi:hypothetical protein